ncbi:hypothetical protein FM106_27345 [Brachybacterium faecium]|nr:hypothetical protein FM106_27345 [Brachybacterium faecium]
MNYQFMYELIVHRLLVDCKVFILAVYYWTNCTCVIITLLFD